MTRSSVFSDDFSFYTAITDSPLHVESTNWELNNTGASASLALNDQAVYFDSTSSSRRLTQIAGQTFTNDQYASVVMSYPGGASGLNAGLLLRAQAPSTAESAYKFVLKDLGSSFVWAIEKYEAGASSDLASATAGDPGIPDIGTGVTLSAECSGNILRLFVNGTLAVEYTDTSNTFTSGVPGLFGFSDTTATPVKFDNFDSGNVASGPSLTVTQTELTPGGTISGSYSAYATVPTTLTVSDGTNTLTIASPTITDNGDGTGTFSGTMPALPTTGTANLVLFGNVTVELS